MKYSSNLIIRFIRECVDLLHACTRTHMHAYTVAEVNKISNKIPKEQGNLEILNTVHPRLSGPVGQGFLKMWPDN